MVSKILGYVRLFGRPYPPSIHGAPEAPNFEKSHQPAAGKVGFSYWKICWFALPLFGKGFFFHIDLERSRNFSCVSNHTSQKNQGLKWLFLGLICMWKKKPPNRPTALKRPRPKVSNRACGVLALVIERDVFFYRSESPSVRSYGFCWLSLFHSILAIFYSSLW